MSQALPYSDFKCLSDAQVRSDEEAFISANKDDALRYLDMATRDAMGMPRILIADLIGVVPDRSARTDIKMDKAYILEVDLEYPEDIHKRDDDYPLAPEVMEIKTDMLSEKQLRLWRLYYGDSNPLSRKLICSLLLKKYYVDFSETLKFYIKQGMKVTKVHCRIRFETKKMFADYIKLNTEQRAAAGKDECKKMFSNS